MRTEVESNLNWDQLEKESLSFLAQDFQLDDSVEVAAQVPFKERLGELYLNGLLPLLLLTGMAFLVSSSWSLSVALLGAGILAPLLTWFLRPFLCRSGRARERRLLAFSFPLLLVAAILSVVPSLGLHQFQGGFLHPELAAYLLQTRLESALAPPALLAYLIVLALLIGTLWKTRESLPWCEPKESKRINLAWRVLVLAVASIGAVAMLWDFRPLTKTEQNWLHNVQAKLESQPYFELPEKGDVKFWEGRFQGIQDALKHTTPGQLPAEKLKSLSGGLKLDLDQHPPRSQEEYVACDAYYFRHLALDGKNPSIHFAQLKLHFQKRPTGDSLFLHDRFPKIMKMLAESEASPPQLKTWLAEVRELKGMLFSREMELDSEVYRILFSRESEHINKGEIGWQANKISISDQPEPKKGWLYKGTIPPSDFKVLGMSFETSPTRIFAAAYKRKLLREWLVLRDEVLSQEHSLQKATLAKLRDQLGHTGTTKYELHSALARYFGVVEEKRSLETCEAILALKLFAAKKGRMPADLPELGLEWDTTSRLKLEGNASRVTLSDSATDFSFPFALEEK